MRSDHDAHDKSPSRARPGRAIETILLASTACLLAAVAWPVAVSGFGQEPSPTLAVDEQPDLEAATPPLSAPTPVADPVIQIALLLDTSSSMDGLIDQARTQLWSVVNALDGATYHGGQPRLEIALYEYGNDSLNGENGWIRRVQPFTSELDTMSEALFSLTTNGGSEFAGQAIGRSIDELEWRDGEGVLRVVYVAGNEAFEQGPVPYRDAISGAKNKDVVINTIFCGSADDSDAAGWREGATLAGGRFLTIDQNHVVQHIAAPQDEHIARLGAEINRTYVRYGADGARGYGNLVQQDANMGGYGMGSVVSRSVSKSSGLYRNDSWDLVDALEADKLEIGEVDKSSLPEEIQGLSDDELRAHVDEKQSKRKELQSQVAQLAKEREAFVAAERARLSAGGDPDSLDGAILGSIREQATAAGFTLNPA